MSHKHVRVDERSVGEQLREQLKNLRKFPSEKVLRCQAFQADRAAAAPFVASTKKEQLLLECVRRFEAHFRESYDARPLLLYPLNEAGVPKFVCSFVRPTQVSFIELFDHVECVRFISNFMMYEELDEPRRFPDTIVSPYNSTRWQVGDSADVAVLTASLLLGAGFDAFVVVGDASHELTKKNENNVACFFLTKEDFELAAEPPQVDARKASRPAEPPAPADEPSATRGSNRLPATGKPGAGAGLTGDRTTAGQFFSFDLTRQRDSFSEQRLFDQYAQVKNAEENPYCRPLVSNAERGFDRLIFGGADTRRRPAPADPRVCAEDIFFKDPSKYVFRPDYEAPFRAFLVDDEPLRLKGGQPGEGGERGRAAGSAGSLGERRAEGGLHFWILVRASGMRDLRKSVLVDPISGRVWETDNPSLPFYSVKQVFNHRNCWINLNEGTPVTRVDFDAFDDCRNEDWEFVLSEEAARAERRPAEEEEAEAAQAPADVTRRLSARKSVFMQTAEAALGAPGRRSARPAPDENRPNERAPAKTFAEKIISMEELFQRPSVWVPKFDISRERFMARFAKNRQRKFYQRCQVDYFSRGTQGDGLVKRVQLFVDHARLLMREVRSYYSDRPDRLRVKREFPFEFRAVEHFDSFGSGGGAVPHWREIETQIGRKIVFKFYPLRFHDGLVEREEVIGEKTIERFANRDDRLVYCSVRFQRVSAQGSLRDTYTYEDRHVGAVQVLKMVQKFERNPRLDGGAQIAKVVIDLERNNIKLIHHLSPQQIAPAVVDTSRECFTGIISRAERKATGPGGQSRVQFLYALEKECFSRIKVAENAMVADVKNFKGAVEEVAARAERPEERPRSAGSMEEAPPPREAPREEELEMDPEDRVEAELRTRGLLGQRIDQTIAEEIKRDVLAGVEDRFVQRADIINRRFEEEKAKVRGMHRKIQKKAFETADPTEDQAFEEELYHFNLKIAILEQRLFNFQKTAFEKYAEVQAALNADPRLNNLDK